MLLGFKNAAKAQSTAGKQHSKLTLQFRISFLGQIVLFNKYCLK